MKNGPAVGRVRARVPYLIPFMMAVVRRADEVGLRILFPRAVRRRLNTLKKALFRKPMRFTFPRASDDGDPIRLVVVGETFADWIPALTTADTWEGLPTVTEVVLLLQNVAIESFPAAVMQGSRVIVLPLSEDAIISSTASYGLYPDAKAVETLRNKRRFADYVALIGMAQFCPADYVRPDEIRLPCIVKHSWEMRSARVLRTKKDVDVTLTDGAWNPEHYVVQEFISGQVEYTTHAIIRSGSVLWSYSLQFEKDGDARIGVEFKTMKAFVPPPMLFEAVERILRPMNYSGPCNIDYTIRESGQIAVFEINPRFGGSLFLAENRPYLKEALGRLLEAACAPPEAAPVRNPP